MVDANKMFWSIPFDGPDRALAILRRRDELGSGEDAALSRTVDV